MFSAGLSAQNINFNHLGLDEGLSQISVNTIYQDEYGQIWIGTRDGLDLYDGTKMTTFHPERGDTTGLPYSNIRKICGNRKGEIYIKSGDALSTYNLHTQQFQRLITHDVMAIQYSNQGLLVATRTELLRYQPQTAQYERLYTFNKPLTATAIQEDVNGNIWIGTETGIYLFNRQQKFQTIVEQVKATSIYEDSRHNIWIGTWENGVFIFDKTLKSKNLQGNLLSSNFVRDICEDNNGNFWLGTFNGLNLYDPNKNTVNCYTSDNSSLSHSSIWCITKDDQGSIWLGTYFGGVNYFNPEYEFYRSQSLSSPIVGKMTEDKNHNLWICTEGGGLNFFNRTENSLKYYRHDPNHPNSISHNNLKSIWYDREKDIIWIGTHTGGLNRFDIKKGVFKTYKKNNADPHSLPDDIIKDIKPYKNQLLLATYNGICLFDPETEKCERLFAKDNYPYNIITVLCLFFDSKNRLWFSVHGEGVFRYDFQTGELKNYRYDANNPNSISGIGINNIFQDHKFRLWFGTIENGLCLYRPETDDFVTYDTKNSGLLSNSISEILESRYGYLLIATGHGFSRFDADRNVFYNYNTKNGFPLSTINDGAAYITNDGEIFLGGVTGLVSFYEKELNKLPKPYHINLERLVVNNKEIKPNEDNHILTEAILMAQKINLNHQHGIFSIEFSTSNYIPSNQKELEYRLIGFDEQWTDTKSRNEVTYTNLNPGTYRFEIREKNPENSDNTIARHIVIEITPPFYKTWYAYLFYAALIIFIIWWLLSYYRTRTLLSVEKQEKKHIEELNQIKLRFFTNISHEFRTPISLIMGQTEMLLETPNLQPNLYNKILSIYKNSRKMKDLISELIDFRKQEQGYMRLKVGERDIVGFLYEIYLSFKENAGYKKLTFTFDSDSEFLPVWFDRIQLQKVFNNLLSNAFKYTPENGEIHIMVCKQEQEVVIRVQDSGIGISKEAQEKVFERFYQEEHKDSAIDTGSGIGLALAKGIVELHQGNIHVESELNKGSTFIVGLPLGYPYKEDEVSIEEPDTATAAFTTDVLEVNALAELLDDAPEIFKTNTPKIFIAEDNDELREMLVNIFESLYQVKSVPDGENAFEIIKEWQPDMVLSDVMMPKVSGTELCSQIKSNFETCHIPVVLLTAQTSIEHNIEGLKLGADDYITKPFNIKVLITRCNNLVNGRKILQEKFSKHPVFSAQLVATNVLDKEVIEKAQTIVEKYLDDSEFDVNVFAREMALGRTKLFAKIKGITGQTPNEFIQTIKLKKGAYWLKNAPEMSVADITYSLGFSSPRYFSKCFKDSFGIAPANFRKDEEDEALQIKTDKTDE
jgi:signal transduction histidine kinase/ligand-binding sensor domain-containing protein/DNA-binding response OmpR family regulator